MGNYIPIARAAAPTRFTVERATLAPIAAFLAKSIVERRNTIPILSNVLVQVDPAGIVAITGTDLDILARWEFPAAVDAAGDAFAVDAAMLADVLKGAAKDAQVSFFYDPATLTTDTAYRRQATTGKVRVTHGRIQTVLGTLPADDFPVIARCDTTPAVIDVATLAIDLARLAPFMSKEETRYYLNGVHFAPAADGRLAMSATNGANLAQIVRDMPEAFAGLESAIIPRKAVAVLAKLAKGRTGDATLALGTSKAQFAVDGLTLTTKLIDGTFPDVSPVLDKLAGAQRLAFYDLEPELSPQWLETCRKALGVAPDVHAADKAFFFTTPDAPEFVAASSIVVKEAGRYGYGSASAAACEYLTDLAHKRGFDLDALHAAALASVAEGEHAPGSFHLVARRGVALGATFGHITQRACKAGERTGVYRPATPDEIEAAVAKMGEGMRGCYERDGIEIIADRDTPDLYADGAFSITMPRERAEAVCSAVQFIADDGMAYPLRVHDGNHTLELSAEAVRRLAGPVDPATHREIAPVAFYQGSAVEPGWFLPTPPKLKGTAALMMSADETRAYLAACRPIWVGLPDAPAVEAVEAAPATLEPVAAIVAPVAPLAPPVAPIEPEQAVPAPDGDVAALTARLAALEAVVARLARPAGRQRSEGERRAILRAWRMRSDLREARAQRAAWKRQRDEYRDSAAGIVEARDALVDDCERLEIAAATARAERDALASRISDAEAYAAETLHAAQWADTRAVRMVRVAARHRTARRRMADDLRGAQAEARALTRRLEASPFRSRIPAAPAITTTDSGAVAARAA